MAVVNWINCKFCGSLNVETSTSGYLCQDCYKEWGVSDAEPGEMAQGD